MKILNLIIIIFFSLLFTTTNIAAYANFSSIDVDLQIFIPPDGVLFLNDLDLTNINNTPVIFGITISNNFPNSVEIVMKLGVDWNAQNIIEGTTHPFMIPPGVTYLTNQDFGTKCTFSQTNINLGELEDIVYSSGKLPEGEYEFFVQVVYQQNVDDEDRVTLHISNPPTVLDLLSPGQPAESIDLPEIYTTLPFFLWHSNASSFRITICEKLPTNSSPHDVMNNDPRMQATVNDITFFPYPSSGVRYLQPGKTYYWQVVAITESSDGPIELESEIWGFKISNLAGGTFSMEHQQILAYLTSFFGGRELGDLFEPGGELDGYTFTGTMFNNGNPMTYEDLNSIIEMIISNHITIDRLYVE